MLPRLLPVSPAELADDGIAETVRICRMLARALRSERTRGRSGHWTYSLDRHLGLAQAYRAERRHLSALRRAVGAAATTAPGSRRDAATEGP